MSERQLFLFWQFNGDNKSYCNQRCPYCYGGKRSSKTLRHYWSGDVAKWEQAFERLNRDIYFVMSYGEAMGSKGFYDCVDMIGRHPNWTLCIVTNLSYNPQRLINSRLGRDRRVFVSPCWHPLGVVDRRYGWDIFKDNVLMLKQADIPTHVLSVWYPLQLKWFPERFAWFDSHDIRVSVRRFVGNIGGFKLPLIHRHLGGKTYPKSYTQLERGYLYASTCPKVTEYGLKLASPKGKPCLAGKDMMLVKHDGQVGLCADCPNYNLGNMFDPSFKLSEKLVDCPTTICGGDYGMLHLVDERFGPLPRRLDNDTFVSQVEGIRQDSPVPYPRRMEMLDWLKKISASLN